jgi:hypothetical protein
MTQKAMKAATASTRAGPYRARPPDEVPLTAPPTTVGAIIGAGPTGGVPRQSS